MKRPGGFRRLAGLLVLAAFGGVLLAVIAQYVFFVRPLAGWNLALWALVGVVIGMGSRTWTSAVALPAVVGFTIVFGYSVMGYQAGAPVLGALGPFAALSLVGAIGMAAAGAAGQCIRRLIRRLRRRPESQSTSGSAPGPTR